MVSGTTKSELSWGMLLLVLRSGYDIFSKMSICERACGSSSRDIIGFSFVQTRITLKFQVPERNSGESSEKASCGAVERCDLVDETQHAIFDT